MKASLKKTVCILMALVLLCGCLPVTVWAEAGGESTTTSTEATASTTATTAPAIVKLDQLRIKGSNSKVYLSTPNLSDTVNAYSFNIPDWMEKVTITFAGKEGIKATCSNNADVSATGTDYAVDVEIKDKKTTVSLTLTKDGATRKLDITINRQKIDCFIEDIMLYSGDNEINPQGEAGSGQMTFTLPSGTLSGVKLRVKPRHEESVSIANTTSKQETDVIADGDKVKLTLRKNSSYYPTDLCEPEGYAKLVEGTNKYYIEVKAGEVTRTCVVTVIVGDPNANAPTTTTTTTTTAPTQPTETAPTAPPTTAPSYQQPVQGGQSGGSVLSGIPTVLWVLIGLIALVVIGSCIFMIVNMSSNGGRRRGYDDYDYDYRPQPPRRRRNLTEYMDDEYDDYGYDRGRGGRYSDYDDYDDYDQPPRRSGRYNDYDGYDDYDQPPRRGGYNDYDDYDGGGY